LIDEYHLNKKDISDRVYSIFQKFDMLSIINKREPFIDDYSRFIAKLIRASMLPDAKIVIDRPSLMMPNRDNLNFIYKSIDLIEFKEIYILIYDWEVGKYGL